MRRRFRILAALALAVLLWWLITASLPDVAALVLLGAVLGGLVARPEKPPAYKPTYWTRQQ